MAFDPVIASIRFGMGRHPRVADPASMTQMLDRLSGPDHAAAAYPIPGLADAAPSVADLRKAGRIRRDAVGTENEDSAFQALQDLRATARRNGAKNALSTFARGMTAEDGLRERLTAFWADHFTVRSRMGVTHHFVTSYVEDAIRPHVAGSFADMLWAVSTHPMMLVYLDQNQSVGPGSVMGTRRGRGLNENYARELLELHTLGVDGAYGQRDVTELAELLTGLALDRQGGFTFFPAQAEPGPETVLGKTYGGDPPELDHIRAFLADLAVRPGTAAHLARKLAVHFVSDAPDADHVAHIAARWMASGGDLADVTAALIEHPAAWTPAAAKVKPPQQFMISSFRALGVDPAMLFDLSERDLRIGFSNPLQEMGQPWEQPPGPDGWPEAAEAWITPQGMATRITWSFGLADLLSANLPDPREFVETAVGPQAPQEVRFAAGAAESRADGVGVVLASAAFQRR